MSREEEAWRDWAAPRPGEDMWEWQDGRCGWCGWDGDALVRDHCHDTGLIRGLLCRACNVHESSQWHTGVWKPWQSGENPAMATKTFEIYVGTTGATPIDSSSALTYYTYEERTEWFKQIIESLTTGGPWPLSVPWTDDATARKEADYAKLRVALNAIFPPGTAARFATGGAS